MTYDEKLGVVGVQHLRIPSNQVITKSSFTHINVWSQNKTWPNPSWQGMEHQRFRTSTSWARSKGEYYADEYRSGKRKNMTIETLNKLCVALDDASNLVEIDAAPLPHKQRKPQSEVVQQSQDSLDGISDDGNKYEDTSIGMTKEMTFYEYQQVEAELGDVEESSRGRGLCLMTLIFEISIVSSNRKSTYDVGDIASNLDDLPVHFSFKELCAKHDLSRSVLLEHGRGETILGQSETNLGQKWDREVLVWALYVKSETKMEPWNQVETKVKQQKPKKR